MHPKSLFDHILGVPNLMVDLINIRTDKLPALRGRKTCQTFRHAHTHIHTYTHTHTHTQLCMSAHSQESSSCPWKGKQPVGIPKPQSKELFFYNYLPPSLNLKGNDNIKLLPLTFTGLDRQRPKRVDLTIQCLLVFPGSQLQAPEQVGCLGHSFMVTGRCKGGKNIFTLYT